MSHCILVVDDEEHIIALFQQKFRREIRDGLIQLEFAHDGQEALALVQAHPPPDVMLILSDINMPGMNGLELLGHSKQRWADLPVMMITAYGDDDNRRLARRLGADDFLTKPIDFAYLKARLEAVLETEEV